MTVHIDHTMKLLCGKWCPRCHQSALRAETPQPAHFVKLLKPSSSQDKLEPQLFCLPEKQWLERSADWCSVPKCEQGAADSEPLWHPRAQLSGGGTRLLVNVPVPVLTLAKCIKREQCVQRGGNVYGKGGQYVQGGGKCVQEEVQCGRGEGTVCAARGNNVCSEREQCVQ